MGYYLYLSCSLPIFTHAKCSNGKITCQYFAERKETSTLNSHRTIPSSPVHLLRPFVMHANHQDSVNTLCNHIEGFVQILQSSNISAAVTSKKLIHLSQQLEDAKTVSDISAGFLADPQNKIELKLASDTVTIVDIQTSFRSNLPLQTRITITPFLPVSFSSELRSSEFLDVQNASQYLRRIFEVAVSNEIASRKGLNFDGYEVTLNKSKNTIKIELDRTLRAIHSSGHVIFDSANDRDLMEAIQRGNRQLNEN